eukprot:jgi/Astpho2/5476/e_gw1.00078.39.1_t
MRLNYNIALVGDNVELLPYRPEHVPVYHQWMEDPELREATASERLSLQEEYEMQTAWAEDPDKLTFIVIDRHEPGADCAAGMCGDVNLFLSNPEEKHSAEIEIMVAEHASRRRGLAQEALTLMMAYAYHHLGITMFFAKVGEANGASVRLFTKLGFTLVSFSQVCSQCLPSWCHTAMRQGKGCCPCRCFRNLPWSSE